MNLYHSVRSPCLHVLPWSEISCTGYVRCWFFAQQHLGNLEEDVNIPNYQVRFIVWSTSVFFILPFYCGIGMGWEIFCMTLFQKSPIYFSCMQWERREKAVLCTWSS